MDRKNPPSRERLRGDAAFRRLAAVAADRGLTLLSVQWQGISASYLFRCSNGHQFERSATVVLRGTSICFECAQHDMQVKFFDVLRQQDFTCEESAYLGQTVRQHFVCRVGHKWEAQARKILEGSGCPQCAARTRSELYTFTDGLERLRKAAHARGGRCIDDQYTGMKPLYTWECSQGHQWRATGAKVVAGSWCRKCAARNNWKTQRSANGMVSLKATAEARGGQCLSEAYVGTNAKYRFRCAQGHEWEARGHLVLRGSWCKSCANLKKRRTIEEMRELALERGGRCLSDTYLGNKVKLTWECSLGHVWDASADNVVSRKAWCPNCFRLRITRDPALRRRYDIDG